ncbi:MAG: ABC transporter substrate-binding protein [Pseudolabrys sp.]
MRRREFITGLAGVVAMASPLGAQQSAPVTHIGILTNVAKGDSVGEARLRAFTERLDELGWREGRNVNFDVRWGEGNSELYRRYAIELTAQAPAVVLAFTSPTVAALQRASRNVPIVFAGAVDPVGAGFVRSLPRPDSNATGFSLFEYSIAGKWLELLKEVAPAVKRVAVIREASIAAGIGQFAAIQAIAPDSLELSVIDVGDANAMAEAIAALAQNENSGLVVTATGFGANHPEVIPTLAARHKLPAVYPFQYFVKAGGLLSYGPNLINGFRLAADYVDRILKGEKPSNLPVQAPTKYELAINLEAAKALGLAIPRQILARADEVIE